MHLPKLMMVVNDLPFLISHRLAIAIAARDEGYDVSIVAPNHPESTRLQAEGLDFIEIAMPRKRGSLAAELRAAAQMWKILRNERPDIVHLITAKPIIFGGSICRLLGIPVIAAISGLGHAFVGNEFKSRVARRLLLLGYRFALKRRNALAIFQNSDNLMIFQRAGIVADRYVMIKGSGTQLDAFDPTPPNNATPVVVLPARMLWTKGVSEFVSAAVDLRSRGYEARFLLAGNSDPGNPASIDEAQLRRWTSGGAVEWIGYQSDIAGLLSMADLVILPSYLEGLPKTIVDACAAGRAVVTTDVPGCRAAIIDGETGLLCNVRDPSDLADKIAELLDDPERLRQMGRQARAFAEHEYDLRKVVRRHLECYRSLQDPSAK